MALFLPYLHTLYTKIVQNEKLSFSRARTRNPKDPRDLWFERTERMPRESRQQSDLEDRAIVGQGAAASDYLNRRGTSWNRSRQNNRRDNSTVRHAKIEERARHVNKNENKGGKEEKFEKIEPINDSAIRHRNERRKANRKFDVRTNQKLEIAGK